MKAKKLGPTAADIQDHLYTSFLQGSTADIALRVHGTWDAIYKLHRVVLIQSEFFRSLFTAGFVESTPDIGSGSAEVVIHFDDPNITRAAFEVCISRLYGGGPELDIDPSLTPTLSQPLTPSFPYQPSPHKVPPKHHPATPRFLLSLLATAVYLSIPSLASQALSSILNTIGPHTVLKYLNFAIGRHIGYLESDEPEAAVGLESVAHLIDYEQSILDTVSVKADSNTDEYHIKTQDESVFKVSTSSTSLDVSEDYETEDSANQPSYHYGVISNKIGEACACWLARWGADILYFEEKQESLVTQKEYSTKFTRKRARTVPSGSVPVPEAKLEEYHVPMIWSRGGLSAKWAAVIISADTFFVKGERERYDFARRVVELRRRHGIVTSEEEEWVKLFDCGIYYSNMNMDDLIHISRDISPTTSRPFVPISTIQASLWTQSVLRHHITARPSRSQSGSVPSPPRHKELGITQTTAALLTTAGTPENEAKVYFPVPGNFVHIGDNGSDFNGAPNGGSLSMDQLFSSTTSPMSPTPSSPTLATATVADSVLTTEAEFFGLRPSIHAASSAIASDPEGKCRWTPYPPCRFAVEFWNLDSLKEKSRLYSHTIWYAGSMFNTYIQVVKKKGQVHLGIYLHRHSSIEPIPPSSAPAPFNLLRNDDGLPTPDLSDNRESGSLPIFSSLAQGNPHQLSSAHPSNRRMESFSRAPSTSSSGPTSPSLPSSLPASSSSLAFPATSPPVAPLQPYRDQRPSISAYFIITCASATGSSQVRFASAPDIFAVNQSWGWKSSSLTEDYMDVQAENNPPFNPLQSNYKYPSLRATVVLGLV